MALLLLDLVIISRDASDRLVKAVDELQDVMPEVCKTVETKVI